MVLLDPTTISINFDTRLSLNEEREVCAKDGDEECMSGGFVNESESV